MKLHALKLIASAVLLSSSNAEAALDCNKDLDACARTLIAETAGFVTVCGSLYPDAKDLFDRAFSHWAVLKFKIPGIAAVIDPKSLVRAQWNANAADYLNALPADKREAECTARLASLTTPRPTLRGNAAQLPPDALKAYDNK